MCHKNFRFWILRKVAGTETDPSKLFKTDFGLGIRDGALGMGE
ncbi:MAG: hypothetical protein SWZ49_12665 [Cyanobacteriota bacterium]|nr:hypothetical protein [Cyanobacteriota bacterium]